MIESFRNLDGTRGGVLLVHGFTGSPFEMQPLAEPLSRAGYSYIGVRCSAHGNPPEEEPNDWSAWQASVDEGFEELREHFPPEKTSVVGLSMGSLLSLDLASRVPQGLRSIVALSPAVELPASAIWTMRIGSLLIRGKHRARKIPKGVSDIRDPDARMAHPPCDPFALSSFLSFNELRLRTRELVSGISHPILIVHARLDRTCPVSGAQWLAGAIGSDDAELHLLDRSGHVMTVDLEKRTVARLVVAFLDRTIGTEEDAVEANPPG